MSVTIGEEYSYISEGAKEIYFAVSYAKSISCCAAMFGGHDLSDLIAMINDSRDVEDKSRNIFLVYLMVKNVGYYCRKHMDEEFLKKELGEEYRNYKSESDTLNFFKKASFFAPMPVSSTMGIIGGPIGFLVGFVFESKVISSAQPAHYKEMKEMENELNNKLVSIVERYKSNCIGTIDDAKKAYYAMQKDGILN